MNLVQDPWLPFRLKDGSEKSLPMSAITRADVVDFALPRADFQGAAYQFAIGLLQTVLAPKNQLEWHDFYEQPPTEKTLQVEFDRAAHAFNCTGDGPLFMQDFDVLAESKSTTIAGLLIEAPGGNGLKLNTDHFIKRGIGSVMSLEMANIALFTLQINAPSGGQGHRTGLRGGGPLTTLVLPQTPESSLWQKLWLNVMNRDFWSYPDPDFSSEQIFPWLAQTKTSEKKGSEVYAKDVHPLQMFWAMPRRIRLELENINHVCELTGLRSDYSVTQYRTQNYGINYSGAWQHPLTPYKWNPKKPDEEPLSAKGQPGGISYKIWDALTLTSQESGQECAQVVKHFYTLSDDFIGRQSEVPRLWAFGYDMDNMKARGWYSTSLPLFSIEPEAQEDILYAVKALHKLSADALWHCRSQVKSAWFEKPGDIKGDMTFIDLEFWQRTERAFFAAVQNVIDNAEQGEYRLKPEQAQAWLRALQNRVIDLFDEYALSELGNERSMAKRIKARQALTGWLYGGKDVKNFIKEYEIEMYKEMA
ncbi:type I-E CRISPR-associated protein Cse1/CasA [Neptuniibacter marinus]|uniref:type I-E CRISPR-associated protein Cse1/CasA n=1 Tax=Neptuniibacter marinus TaxID=1806670 RepID=UPI003B5BBFF6